MKTTSAAPFLAILIEDLVTLGRDRDFMIRMQIRNGNALGAKVRSMCGWRPPQFYEGDEKARIEKDNKAAVTRAGKLLKAVRAGTEIDDPLMAKTTILAAPVLLALQGFDDTRDSIERQMKRAARQLPVWAAFGKGVSGFGELALAVIVAECGRAPGDYRSVAALWKRLGLAVINGERQRKYSDKELAALHGYDPHRRASVWAFIDDAMFRNQWAGADEETGAPAHPTGPYGEAYGRKKAQYMQRVADTIDLPAKDPAKWTAGRAEKAARRYMAKCLLRDLWAAWRRAAASSSVEPKVSAPLPANPSAA